MISYKQYDTDIIINDLIVNYNKHAQIFDGPTEFVGGKNSRPFNPVNYAKNRKWERMIGRVRDKNDVRKSMLDYYCRIGERWGDMEIEINVNNSVNIVREKEIEIRRYERDMDGVKII